MPKFGLKKEYAQFWLFLCDKGKVAKIFFDYDD